jgi:hypothetical protein
MLRKSATCLAVLGLFVAGAAMADSVASVRVGNRTVEIDETSDDTAAPLRRLALIQRSVRESLLGAALTPDQMGSAFEQISEFTNSYAKAVMTNAEVVQNHSFNELFAAKVTPNLRSLGVRDEESVAVSALVGEWSNELVNLPEDVLGSIEVRR